MPKCRPPQHLWRITPWVTQQLPSNYQAPSHPLRRLKTYDVELRLVSQSRVTRYLDPLSLTLLKRALAGQSWQLPALTSTEQSCTGTCEGGGGVTKLPARIVMKRITLSPCCRDSRVYRIRDHLLAISTARLPSFTTLRGCKCHPPRTIDVGKLVELVALNQLSKA